MANDTIVYLYQKVRASNDKKYTYWYLQWRDGTGKTYHRSIGSVQKISNRQAEKKRRGKKEHELKNHPERRNMCRAPFLNDWLAHYEKSRKHEVSLATISFTSKQADT